LSIHTFDGVSGEYGRKSLVQQQAARKLIGLLDLRAGESVLDVGCGPGHLTILLAEATGELVVGMDISGGMIEQARSSYPAIEFRRVAAEDLEYAEEFDVVFCSSTMQWFADAGRAVDGMFAALKPGGRLGLACPSTPDFAPWFNDIVAVVAERPEIAPTFAHWRKPWWHLPDMDSYREFFEEHGFTTRYIELEHEVNDFTVDEAFGIYSTGAAQGFIGRAYYDIDITDEYLDAFSAAVRAEMEARAVAGVVKVDFNRLYYTGSKLGDTPAP
jgi:ubiquinone/menaquinone biosynthesis C-methylase UbiE